MFTRELGESSQALPESAKDLDLLGLKNNSDWTGLYVWTASILMSRWIISQKAAFDGKSVLELGAGCGLPGLTALTHTTCRKVTITDLHQRTVDNISHNTGTTGLEIKSLDFSRCSSSILDWLKPSTWPNTQFDIILGSDVVYHEAQAGMLSNVLKKLLKPGGVFLMVHAAARAGLAEFCDALENAGFSQEAAITPSEKYYELLPGMSTQYMDLHFPEFNTSAGFLFRKFTKASI